MSENLSALGMMSEPFFRPRRELLDWLRADFECNITKLEECANGAMYLHIFDKAFPGKVPMQKVQWNAAQEYEMTKNYKLLQEVFKVCGLNRSFEISRLTKGRQQDNLEFLQWVKYVYDRQMQNHPNDKYNPVERRLLSGGPLPDWAAPPGERSAKAGNHSSDGVSTATSHKREASNSLRAQQYSAGLRQAAKSNHPSVARKPSGQFSSKMALRPSAETQRLEELEREVKQLREKCEEAITVKEFFLNKLKAIEFLCMKDPDSPLDQSTVLQILYSEQLVELKCEPTPPSGEKLDS